MAENIGTLQELVNSICERLHSEKQLITNQSIKKLVLLHENWVMDAAELDQQLPNIINTWRLTSLYADQDEPSEAICSLTAQLCKVRSDLMNAQYTIKQLKTELLTKNSEIKMLRIEIIDELRGLLHG